MKKPKCLIAEKCREKEITIYELAKSLGYHPNKFYDYVNGKYAPNVSLALKIAKKLKCNVEDIFTFDTSK